MNSITISTKSGEAHTMSYETYARWLCLMEAIDHVKKAAERNNIKLSKSKDWVKPLAFQKYIDERFHAMLHDAHVEEGVTFQTFNKLPEFAVESPMIDDDIIEDHEHVDLSI